MCRMFSRVRGLEIKQRFSNYVEYYLLLFKKITSVAESESIIDEIHLLFLLYLPYIFIFIFLLLVKQLVI